MINEYSVNAFCCEDISKIENYDKAVADKTQSWHCHHKVEILPCGNFTPKDLKKYGLYYHRPANELVFLTLSQHTAVHNSHRYVSDDVREKLRQAKLGNKNPNFGKSRPNETKAKISSAHKGMKIPHNIRKKISEKLKGIHWYNNGIITVGARECPPSFVRGRLVHKPSV